MSKWIEISIFIGLIGSYIFFLNVFHQCLKPPYGVLFISTKKHYVGFNSAARQLRNLVEEDGVFGTHLIKEVADREIWKFFLK